MKNAFVRAGKTCVATMMFAGLTAVGVFAGQATPVIVTLPHAVTVGNRVLPGGEYTITSLDIANGDAYFLIRSAHTPAVTLQAQKVTTTEETPNTEVVFSKDGDTWRFDKMSIQGQDATYQFINTSK